MKKDTLYTVNKWNKKLFFPGGPLNSNPLLVDKSGQNTSVVGAPTGGIVMRDPSAWGAKPAEVIAPREVNLTALGSTENKTGIPDERFPWFLVVNLIVIIVANL